MRSPVAGLVLVVFLATGCGAGTPSATGTAAGSPGKAAVPTPSPTPFPTPYATQAAGLDAFIIPLGADAAPLGIIYAEGSVWVALHHGDGVLRLDPATGAVIARIPTGPRSGPAWFTVGDGSIWVTNQNGAGVSRINPDTNTVSAAIGADPPCGLPAFFESAVWIDACDAPALIRYDAATNALADRIDTPEAMTPIAVGDELWGVGEQALYRIDPDSNDVSTVMQCCGSLGIPAVRDDELWTGQETDALTVVDTRRERHGEPVAVEQVTAVVFDRRSAWALSSGGGAKLTEIDLSSSQPLETYQFGVQLPSLAIVDGKLWITDFALSQVFVITPP